ncbi:neuralized-like protein 4 [Ischnura elegans]|uniref:neuralized-like protein 4 n=1 Tax=Ischnura elegans TaxID=197161 RepID=UPI001ED8A165|nr:neuralized-like protein 4 [Ischnura elegans]
MSSQNLLQVAILFCGVFAHAICSGSVDSDCPGTVANNGFQLSIRSERNGSGDWVSRVSGYRDVGDRTEKMALDLSHRVVPCNGKTRFIFEGNTGGTTLGETATRLSFHPKCGTNVAIFNNGRTIQKINGDDKFHGVGYTKRPLHPDELFELMVDRRSGKKFGCSLGIGVTTTAPHDGEISSHINYMKPVTVVMYHSNVYINGSHVLSNRPYNLDLLQAGDRVGIMRTKSGGVIVVINGKEYAVASNMPEPVYGVFECYGDPVQATIV